MRLGDLNLLMHFDALMSWRSVTRAAEALEISQPAMSAALSRLRRLFNDPLLTRENGIWLPTHRAQELHTSFRPMLDLWRQVSLPRDSFDPKTSRRSLSFFGTDYVQFTVVGRMVSRLTREAPGIEIRVQPAKPGVGLEMLDTNEVELICGYFPEPAANLRTRFLFQERAVVLVRNGHPCLKSPWGLDNYLAHGHINLGAHTNHFGIGIDKALESRSRSRRICLSLASYLACPFAVANSDLVATVPESVAKALAKQAGAIVLEAPLALPMFSVSLYWHERHHRDAAHSWVRQLIGSMF